jgi:hypothetical protein
MNKEYYHIYELADFKIYRFVNLMGSYFYEWNDIRSKMEDIVYLVHEERTKNRLLASSKINDLIDDLYDAVLLKRLES